MLDIDISKWAQRIPKIMEHRPVVEAFRMAADTTGWSPTEILCQRARFIVDKDQGNMLPRDSSRIAWSYEVVIRLLFAVLYDLINDREGFCSKMLGPLNAQWDFPWTPAETKLEELADFESHSLPQEHDEDLDRSSRGLSTIDEEEEGFVKVSEPADKDKAAGDNADDNDEDNAIDTGELGDEDEFSLSEHSEHSSRSFTAHEPDISDREDAYEARNPDAVRQHIE
ncbi:hypothetical protein BDV97DRAFT_202115 [Delphinella strobiligena]|nr:hypothetical protein BDV97DRAFT_202115 [Delphinella strobiligena]